MASYDIRLPAISGRTEAEQIQQMRSYLYQLAEQINFALNSISGVEVSQADTVDIDSVISQVLEFVERDFIKKSELVPMSDADIEEIINS